MNKQKTQFIIFAFVLIVGVLLLAVLKNKPQEEETQADTIYLCDISRDEMVRIGYDYKGETLSFVPETSEDSSETTWVCEGDKERLINQTRVNNIVNKAIALQAEAVLENPSDLADYGLAEPEQIIRWETADRSYEFYVGDYNSTAKVTYLYDPSTETVYTVTSQSVAGFNYTLDEMTETPAEESTEE